MGKYYFQSSAVRLVYSYEMFTVVKWSFSCQVYDIQKHKNENKTKIKLKYIYIKKKTIFKLNSITVYK